MTKERASPPGTLAADVIGAADRHTPWWAIALLDLPPDSPEHKVRTAMNRGKRTHLRAPSWWGAWQRCIDLAHERVMQRPLEDWLDAAYAGSKEGATSDQKRLTAIIRDAALSSERAFVGLAGLVDEEGAPIILKDFHVQTIRRIRQVSPTVQLLPWQHGKTVLSSIVIPLMDWAEWPNATEGRIYWSDSHVQKWVARLMGQVEHNDNLHRLFPWIRKPTRSDKAKRWSAEGFCIGGRELEDVSFEPLTVQKYATGNRYSRVICDDWVTTGNAASLTVQDKMHEYFGTGPMTMPQKVQRASKYGTAWPTIALLGTLFNENDVNYRVYHDFKRLGHDCRRVDVFPNGNVSIDRREVIWPEYRDFDYIMKMKADLGRRVFNMRCRNIVEFADEKAFPEQLVLMAECDGREGRQMWQWGVPPWGARLLIGFDPGSGKLRRESKNPAIVLYAEMYGPLAGQSHVIQPESGLRDGNRTMEDVFSHVVKWQRLAGYTFTRQCDVIAQWAREYQCPVAVEDNGVQTAYADYMRSMYADVRIITHTTTHNRRDPRDGVEQFVPMFEQQRLRIHAAGAPGQERIDLRRELVGWPQHRYTDLVMALWIARYQSRLRSQVPASSRPARVPTYARGFATRSFSFRKVV